MLRGGPVLRLGRSSCDLGSFQPPYAGPFEKLVSKSASAAHCVVRLLPLGEFTLSTGSPIPQETRN